MSVGSGGMAGDVYDQPGRALGGLIDDQLSASGGVVQDYKSAIQTRRRNSAACKPRSLRCHPDAKPG